MEDNGANKLDVIDIHIQESANRFSDKGVTLGQKVVQRLAVPGARCQQSEKGLQLRIAFKPQVVFITSDVFYEAIVPRQIVFDAAELLMDVFQTPHKSTVLHWSLLFALRAKCSIPNHADESRCPIKIGV
jgi:hypothetical protein